jgi:hypothetical protein
MRGDFVARDMQYVLACYLSIDKKTGAGGLENSIHRENRRASKSIDPWLIRPDIA